MAALRVSYPLLTPTMTCSCHGDRVTCPGCSRRIEVGQPYSLAPQGFTASGQLEATVMCVYCSGQPSVPERIEPPVP